MANIIGLQKQEEALKEIQSIIKNLDIANTFMATENPTGIFTISFKDKNGKKQMTDICVDKKLINDLVNGYKAERRDYVKQKANEYRIALDPEDDEILGDGNKSEE